MLHLVYEFAKHNNGMNATATTWPLAREQARGALYRALGAIDEISRVRMSIIHTNRLGLIPAPAEFIELLVAHDYRRAGELLNIIVPDGWPHDHAAHAGLSFHLKAIRSNPLEFLWRMRLVVLRSNRTVTGSVNLKGPPDERGMVEIGWGVSPEYRRQGIAVEASEAVMEWICAQPEVRRIIATIPAGNRASIRVAERLGMKATGEHRRDLPVWGDWGCARPRLTTACTRPASTGLLCARHPQIGGTRGRVMPSVRLLTVSYVIEQLLSFDRRFKRIMFCPKCGKPEQQVNAFCRKCGLFLPDFDTITSKVISPEQHFSANTILSIMTAVVSLALSITLYVMFLGKDNTPIVIYLTAGFLTAMFFWQAQVLWRTTQLNQQFPGLKRKNEEWGVEKPREVESKETRQLLGEADLRNVVPSSRVENDTSKSSVVVNRKSD